MVLFNRFFYGVNAMDSVLEITREYIEPELEETSEGIMVYKQPQTVDLGLWSENHLDVDAIYNEKDGKAVIYAFSKSKEYNSKLRSYRKINFKDQFILKGVSSNGLNSIF